MKLYKLKDASKFLGLSLSQTRSLARSQTIPATKLYGAYYLAHADIENYLNNILSPKRRRVATAAEIDAIPDGCAKRCGKGHWLVEWNVYANGKKRKRRRCKICSDQQSNEYRKRNPVTRVTKQTRIREPFPLTFHEDGLGASFS